LSISTVFVLGKGEPDKPLNYDAKMRCEAVRVFIQGRGLIRVYFVGGKPEKGKGVPVAVQMKRYFDSLTGLAHLSETLYESNNSFGNVQEIINVAGKKNFFWILANDYQLPRFLRIFSKLGIDQGRVIPISAEQQLMNDPQRIREIWHYRHSLKYKLRIVLEKILTFWMIFDREYKVITVWRKIRRGYL